MKSWQKKISPYEGTEPYLYLAFADADAGKVWGLLRPLLERGCRVWYAAGSAGSPEELLRRQERAGNAALTAVYLSRAVTEDKDTKSAVLANQSMNRPILCLDDDGEDRTLAMGLRETTPHIPVYRYRDKAEAEEELVRAEGFTQEMLGEPVKIAGGSVAGKLAAGLCVLAVLLLAVGFAGWRYLHWFQPEIPDAVVLEDSVIAAAARSAVGGPLTEEALDAVTALSLSGLPESWEELALFPALERIELPQSAAAQAETLPEGVTVVLKGGEGA